MWLKYCSRQSLLTLSSDNLTITNNDILQFFFFLFHLLQQISRFRCKGFIWNYLYKFSHTQLSLEMHHIKYLFWGKGSRTETMHVYKKSRRLLYRVLITILDFVELDYDTYFISKFMIEFFLVNFPNKSQKDDIN